MKAPKRPRNTNQLAKLIVDMTSCGAGVDAGRARIPSLSHSGTKGGKARTSSLTSERHAEIVRAAAAKRWKMSTSSE